jgi:hypothetical protein
LFLVHSGEVEAKGFGVCEVLVTTLYVADERSNRLMLNQNMLQQIPPLSKDFVTAKHIAQKVGSRGKVNPQVAQQIMLDFKALATLEARDSVLHSVFTQLREVMEELIAVGRTTNVLATIGVFGALMFFEQLFFQEADPTTQHRTTIRQQQVWNLVLGQGSQLVRVLWLHQDLFHTLDTLLFSYLDVYLHHFFVRSVLHAFTSVHLWETLLRSPFIFSP